jgi:adenylosuccinate synthase
MEPGDLQVPPRGRPAPYPTARRCHLGQDAETDAQIAEATDADAISAAYLAAGDRLRSHVVDGQAVVDDALDRGDRILLEGQLGTMRDIDWGSTPT